MSEIEKVAESEITKKINELEVLLYNYNKLMPRFYGLKSRKKEIREHYEKQLQAWQLILNIFKKSIYK